MLPSHIRYGIAIRTVVGIHLKCDFYVACSVYSTTSKEKCLLAWQTLDGSLVIAMWCMALCAMVAPVSSSTALQPIQTMVSIIVN